MKPAALKEAKSALREAVLARREALGEEERRAFSERILRRVRRLADYRRAGVVLAYSGFGSELQTGDFLRSVLEDGKLLVLPRIERATRTLNLHAVRDLDADLEPGVWGIREPREDLPTAGLPEVDFVLVPGVAFDRRGGRLGHGAGFYDRLLGSSAGRPKLVAGAYEAQMVEEVPTEPHDVLVDLVITEKGAYPP